MEANYISHYIEDEQELYDLVQCPKRLRPAGAGFEVGYTILIGAVDNDKSRVMCHSVFQNARRLIYIDSGNGEYQGQVVCGVKLDGHTFNRSLISVFPTVLESEDKFPTELSCEEAAISAPQSMAANLTAASIVVNYVYNIVARGQLTAKYSTFSTLSLTTRTVGIKKKRRLAA